MLGGEIHFAQIGHCFFIATELMAQRHSQTAAHLLKASRNLLLAPQSQPLKANLGEAELTLMALDILATVQIQLFMVLGLVTLQCSAGFVARFPQMVLFLMGVML
jgi:hypothetical protein